MRSSSGAEKNKGAVAASGKWGQGEQRTTVHGGRRPTKPPPQRSWLWLTMSQLEPQVQCRQEDQRCNTPWWQLQIARTETPTSINTRVERSPYPQRNNSEFLHQKDLSDLPPSIDDASDVIKLYKTMTTTVTHTHTHTTTTRKSWWNVSRIYTLVNSIVPVWSSDLDIIIMQNVMVTGTQHLFVLFWISFIKKIRKRK